MSEPQGYLDAVTAWLRGHINRDDVTVTSVTTYGSDWGGSTEVGFYDTFEVSISWVSDDGATGYEDVRGELLPNLWQAVVGAAWPEVSP